VETVDLHPEIPAELRMHTGAQYGATRCFGVCGRLHIRHGALCGLGCTEVRTNTPPVSNSAAASRVWSSRSTLLGVFRDASGVSLPSDRRESPGSQIGSCRSDNHASDANRLKEAPEPAIISCLSLSSDSVSSSRPSVRVPVALACARSPRAEPLAARCFSWQNPFA
jgi:hypothetical protein